MSESRFSWEMVVTGVLLTVLAIIIVDSNGNNSNSNIGSSVAFNGQYLDVPQAPTPPDAPQLQREVLVRVEMEELAQATNADVIRAQAEAFSSIEGTHNVKEVLARLETLRIGESQFISAEVAKSIQSQLDAAQAAIASVSTNNETLNFNFDGKQMVVSKSIPSAQSRYDKGLVVKEDVFSAASLKDVHLKTVGGNIHITGGNDNQVRIRIIATGRDATIDKVNERYEVKLGRSGNELVAEVNQKSRGLLSSVWNNNNISMNIIVETPSDMQFNARTSGGNIEASSLNGKQYLKTSGGNVRLDAMTGNGEIATSGGNITAKDLDGAFTLTTSGGNMNFERCSGAISAKTSGGNITLDFLNGSLDAKTSGGNIRATLHKVDNDVNLSTSAGTITINLPETASCNLMARGGSVNVDKSFNTDGVVKRDEVDVRMNGGGPIVNARTSAGSVNITKLR
jgi:hypothetical protein